MEQLITLMQTSLIPFISAHWLELLAALVNFVWVYLEYRASIWLWPVGIVLPILYIAVSWQALFLGNILVNVYYFITSIIGWIMWLRRAKAGDSTDEGDIPITSVKPKDFALHLLLALPTMCLLYFVLRENSSMPYLDAVATVASFLGMIYLSRKQIQHWFCWMLANSLSLVIFYSSGDMITSFVFAVNFIVSVLGYFRWAKDMKHNEALPLK